MPITGFRRMLALTATLLLAGCASYYMAPPGLTPDLAVSVLGSKEVKSPLQCDEYHLVWAVDGWLVKDAGARWDQPLLVAAGETHRLTLAYGCGGVSGSVTVEVNARPGSKLVVKGETVDPESSARLWLADAATGAVVGTPQPVRLSWFPSPPLPRPMDALAIKLVDQPVPPR